MKRFLSALLLAALMLSLAAPALAVDEPHPIRVLKPEEIRETPKGIHHYMLVCIDSWATDLKKWGNHTDGLILVTVDEIAQRVMITSFIRDMLIQRPDGKFGRINNFLDPDGWTRENKKTPLEGLHALIDTINGHFDLRIEKFIVVDFKQVENIINAVGGVDISITAREANYLKNYPISASSTTPSITGGGTYHFSGHAAVIYMRCRKSVSAVNGEKYDYRRTTRARNVLVSLKNNLSNISWDQARQLLDVIVSNTLVTDMTPWDLYEAAEIAFSLKQADIDQFRIPIDGTHRTITYSSGSCEEVDFPANREALWEYLGYNSFVVREDDE